MPSAHSVLLMPNSLMTPSASSTPQSADWGVEEAEGFIKLFGMSSTLWAEINR